MEQSIVQSGHIFFENRRSDVGILEASIYRLGRGTSNVPRIKLLVVNGAIVLTPTCNFVHVMGITEFYVKFWAREVSLPLRFDYRQTFTPAIATAEDEEVQGRCHA
eukprot:scaffold9720_cov122-Skeletonema_dohrnii-CCMP3373.AAC.4